MIFECALQPVMVYQALTPSGCAQFSLLELQNAQSWVFMFGEFEDAGSVALLMFTLIAQQSDLSFMGQVDHIFVGS